MSDFEPFDDELANALRRRAGRPTTSTAAAHDAVLRRAGAIRRRRVALAGGAAMAVLLVGGVLMLPRDVDQQVPAVSGDVLPSIDETSTSVSAATPDVDPVDEDAAPSTSAPSTSAPSSSVPVDPVPTAPPSTSDQAPTSDPAPTTTAPSTLAPSTSQAAGSAPFTDTYQSTGGAITVSWDGAALSLQAVSPAPGFVGEVEDRSATRVRVRFESADEDSRIEVRVTDGRVVVDVD